MSNIESVERLWGTVKEENGTSHGREHIERVLACALKLHEWYGGERDIIEAAVILHDIGRTDTSLHGIESRNLSVIKAKEALTLVGWPPEKIERVCFVIEEHDQPNISAQTTEGKILKDADFLDGFGARGVLRTLMWTGESGQPLTKATERLKVKMPQRIQGLEFPESRVRAFKEYTFVRLFLELLDRPPEIERLEPGSYIVFEGTSGSGKDTQAQILSRTLEERDIKTKIIHELSEETSGHLKEIRSLSDDAWVHLLTFMTDRSISREQILNTRREGGVAIGVRSFVSSMVYQAENPYEEALNHFIHAQFMPDMSTIFFLDVNPEIAMRRISARNLESGQHFGRYENLEDLTRHRERYHQVIAKFQNSVTVDANRSPEKTSDEILNILSRNPYPKMP